MENKTIIDSFSNQYLLEFKKDLTKYLLPIIYENRPIVILCIGTDRSTGDSLGPLTGEKLNILFRNDINIYGTLEKPVHAKNLVENLNIIESKFDNPYIIAIDACLGSLENVGKVIIEDKPLCPGAALKKDLPKVGDLSITGIVNIAGSLEFMILQNTRLFTVFKLANVIAHGLHYSIVKIKDAIDSDLYSKEIR